MKIKQILTQTRRDFVAIFECEHCHSEIEKTGYDDSFFHDMVIPKMKCSECGKTSDNSYKPLQPKYSADTII
jgi:hypothetical protein